MSSNEPFAGLRPRPQASTEARFVVVSRQTGRFGANRVAADIVPDALFCAQRRRRNPRQLLNCNNQSPSPHS
jgi:hypothetical protein